MTTERRLGSSEHSRVQELAARLATAGIDVAKWGVGGAKTVAHLQKEIEEGESDVVFCPEGNVSRHVRVAWVDVIFFGSDGEVYHLYEDRQEFKDGRVRRRQLNSSLGEKFKPDEEPADAAVRALHEELGIRTYESLHAVSHEHTTHTPDSYPGLKSQYDTYSFVSVIDASSFDPNGYVEIQADKTNYYAWNRTRPAASV